MPKKPYHRPETPNRGAADERSQIKRGIYNLPMLAVCTSTDGISNYVSVDAVIEFIDGMAPRANAKPGGLGRKWTAKKKGSKTNRTGQK